MKSPSSERNHPETRIVPPPRRKYSHRENVSSYSPGKKNVLPPHPMEYFREEPLEKPVQAGGSFCGEITSKVGNFLTSFWTTVSEKKVTIFTITGSIFILLAVVSLLTLPSIIIRNIHKRLILKQGSETYENWKQVPVPVYNRFYFFNVINAGEVERLGAKPELAEVGPFTYRVLLRKQDIQHDHSNGTVSYRERRTWIFIRNQSVADETTLISTLNTPLAMTLSWLKNASPAVRLVVGVGLDTTSQGFFIKRSVKQLLFEGYPDMLTTFGPLLRPELPAAYNGRFGFFFPKNNTDDGVYRVHTGEDDINLLNVMDSHNGNQRLKYWSSEECNSLNGSTKSEVRPPASLNNREIRMFNAEICRVLRLLHEKDYTNSHGIRAKKFILSPEFYKNPIDHPPNACYYIPRPSRASPLLSLRTSIFRRDPLPSGIMDLGPCKYGAPIFLSNPHFMDADPVYASLVSGMKPNRSRHTFWMDIEPTTGSTIQVAARIQLNVAINTGQSSIRYRNVPEIVFPILWSEYTSNLTPRLAEKLRLVQWIPGAVSSITFYLFLAIGLINFIIASTIYTLGILKSRSNNKSTAAAANKPTLPPSLPSAPATVHNVTRRPLPLPPGPPPVHR